VGCLMPIDRRALLHRAFMSGVERCRAATVLPPQLSTDAPLGRTIVLGAGKAAADMAAVASRHLKGEVVGCVVTRTGHGTSEPTGAIRVIEAGHPLPDGRSREAAEQITELARQAGPNDRVLFMISGGGSSLLAEPLPGVSMDEKRDINDILIRSGAAIDEINTVRRALSNVKGGKLGALAGARGAELVTYVISDVAGDDPSVVASGPSVSHDDQPGAAQAILERYGYAISDSTKAAIASAERVSSPPHRVVLLACNRDAMDAAATFMRHSGYDVADLGDLVTGIASDVGRSHAGLAAARIGRGRPTAIISGGELTVQVRRSSGQGGPNLEYLAGVMLVLGSNPHVHVLACDTDGIDGIGDHAGGYVSPETLKGALALGFDPAAALKQNATYAMFSATGSLIKTGPTLTNVNDLRILLVGDAVARGTLQARSSPRTLVSRRS
jgi:glycerate 2-kinase